ncbi:MAG: 2-hydroxychromene-2-carboxylate isomerase [Myxococcota bacterium]
MADLQFWFDYSCPYAYLASTQVEAVAARTGATLQPRPMLLGGLFKHWSVPQNLAVALPEAKARHNANDLRRWAALFGAEWTMPAGHPFRSVDALRATLVAGVSMPLIHAFFRTYWVQNQDISDREVIRRVLTEQGHDADAVFARIDTDEVKDDLRQRTDEAIRRGFWGAPGFVVDDEIYWGQDRLHQVESALGGTAAPLFDEGPMSPVDIYFDFSSPYAYFGMTRAEAVFGDHATYKPMLLGAVFSAVGQHNMPMMAMNDAKRRYNILDMKRISEAHGIPFNFPAQFPLRSVLPLRVTLAAKAHESAEGRRLVHRLLRAYWSEGQDISQPEVVIELCAELGFDGAALVEATKDPKIKDALRVGTEDAVKAGVFGAPTFVVHRADRAGLFWGVDRIELAARAARGDDAVL